MGLLNLKRNHASMLDLVDGGAGLLSSLAAAGGNIIYLDPTNGSDGNDGSRADLAVATLTQAYALTTNNNHDIVAYIAGTSSISLSAKLTWSNSYTHLIGICAPSPVAQRSRIFQTASATGLSPLLDITGSGCVFANFYIFQGVADATSLINVQVTGSRNYFENVHFAGGGHATQAVDGGASLKINGGSENRFVNCTFGVDTIAAGTGMTAITFDGSASRNMFKDCLINLYIGNSGATLVELIDTSSLDRWTRFIDCEFFSNSTNKATTMSSAWVIPAGHTTTASVLFKDCAGIGFTDWDANDRGILYFNNGTITAGGNSGFYAVSAVT